MALLIDQKYKILRYLGYSFGTIETTSLDYSNIVTKRLDAITGAAQTEVEQVLLWIDQTETELDAKIKQAGVKRIDDIEFFENSHNVLKSEKTRYIKELSQMLGLPKLNQNSMMGDVIV